MDNVQIKAVAGVILHRFTLLFLFVSLILGTSRFSFDLSLNDSSSENAPQSDAETEPFGAEALAERSNPRENQVKNLHQGTVRYSFRRDQNPSTNRSFFPIGHWRQVMDTILQTSLPLRC